MQSFRKTGNEGRNIVWKAKEYFKASSRLMQSIENVIEK
jgi:hypothetical protein